MTSIEIMNMITALRTDQAIAVTEERMEDSYRIDGHIAALNDQLRTTIENEAARLRDAVPAAPARRASIAEMAFGPRASFKGLTDGFRAAITIPSAPSVNDPTIPGMPDLPRGFADTLTQSPTDGSVDFLQRGTATNAAAQWASGAKPESAYVWTSKNAPLTWIAHTMPITRTQASDYGQLESLVSHDMLLGLAQAKSAAALVGSNASGVTGVTNTVGIQTYTQKAGDNIYDSIRRMFTRAYLGSGFIPTHAALTPQVKEELDLLKGDDGHYLLINVGGNVWGLEIVQDTNLTIADATNIHNGSVVYASIGATWYTKETDNLAIGLVNSQFVENAYTLRAESRNALAVRYPAAFVFEADAIPAEAV